MHHLIIDQVSASASVDTLRDIFEARGLTDRAFGLGFEHLWLSRNFGRVSPAVRIDSWSHLFERFDFLQSRGNVCERFESFLDYLADLTLSCEFADDHGFESNGWQYTDSDLHALQALGASQRVAQAVLSVSGSLSDALRIHRKPCPTEDQPLIHALLCGSSADCPALSFYWAHDVRAQSCGGGFVFFKTSGLDLTGDLIRPGSEVVQ